MLKFTNKFKKKKVRLFEGASLGVIFGFLLKGLASVIAAIVSIFSPTAVNFDAYIVNGKNYNANETYDGMEVKAGSSVHVKYSFSNAEDYYYKWVTLVDGVEQRRGECYSTKVIDDNLYFPVNEDQVGKTRSGRIILYTDKTCDTEKKKFDTTKFKVVKEISNTVTPTVSFTDYKPASGPVIPGTKVKLKYSLTGGAPGYSYKWSTHVDTTTVWTGECLSVDDIPSGSVDFGIDTNHINHNRYGKITVYSDKKCSTKVSSTETKKFSVQAGAGENDLTSIDGIWTKVNPVDTNQIWPNQPSDNTNCKCYASYYGYDMLTSTILNFDDCKYSTNKTYQRYYSNQSVATTELVFEAVRDQIQNGKPVIVRVTAKTATHHYILITGTRTDANGTLGYGDFYAIDPLGQENSWDNITHSDGKTKKLIKEGGTYEYSIFTTAR